MDGAGRQSRLSELQSQVNSIPLASVGHKVRWKTKKHHQPAKSRGEAVGRAVYESASQRHPGPLGATEG